MPAADLVSTPGAVARVIVGELAAPGRVSGAAVLATAEGVGVGLLAGFGELFLADRQRRGDVFEIALGGVDAHHGLDDPAGNHHHRADHVADEDLRGFCGMVRQDSPVVVSLTYRLLVDVWNCWCYAGAVRRRARWRSSYCATGSRCCAGRPAAPTRSRPGRAAVGPRAGLW
jgi:hypothetical protein